MATNEITPGTRMQLCFAPPVGQAPEFDLSSSYFKTIDDACFLASVPLKGGKPVPVSETQKLLVRYSIGAENMVISAYCDDVVKQGIRTYWKLRRVSEQRHFFQRKDERYKVTLRAEYSHPSWTPIDGKVDREEAVTLDISAGGAALFMNNRFDVGDVCHLFLPRVSSDDEGQAINDIVAAICWYRDAPIGSPCRFIGGVQFRFVSDEERDEIRSYVENIKKVYKL